MRGTEKTALQKYVIVCLGAEGFCENFDALQLDLESEVGLPGAGHVPQMTIMDIHGHSINIHGFSYTLRNFEHLQQMRFRCLLV